jgi:Flp pilus assembly protein TadD
MRRTVGLAALLLSVTACGPTAQEERVRAYKEDGLTLFQRGSYAAARDSFEAALRLTPCNPDLLFHLAQCQDRLNQTTQAEQIYRQCIQLEPNNVECRHTLDVLLVREKRLADARALVNDWMQSAPNLPAPLAEDGWLLMQEGKLIDARRRLQTACSRNVRDGTTWTRLGEVFEKLGLSERALYAYEQAVRFDPQQTEAAERVSVLRSEGVGRPHPE